MSRAKKLQVLARYESIEQRKRMAALSQAQKVYEEQKALTARLLRYMDDYAETNSQATRIWQLQNSSSFTGNLRQALLLQHERERQAKEVYEQARSAWLTDHARQQSLGQLIDDAVLNEQRLNDNREDREAEDNWASHRKTH